MATYNEVVSRDQHGRGAKRDPLDVAPVRVCEEEMGTSSAAAKAVLQELVAKPMQSHTTVKNKTLAV